MALSYPVPEISYTSRDYQSILSDEIRAIPHFTPEWTDHNETDFGVVISELFAMVHDALHFYIDRQYQEGFIGTARKRESVRELLKLIDYELGTANPSSVDIEFTLPTALLTDLLIPAGTKVQTVSDVGIDPVLFETVTDLIILAGGLTGTIGALEGLSGEEELGLSNGTQLQRFEISFERIIDSSLKVFIDEGSGDEEWIRVDSFIESKITDKHYTAERSGTPELVLITFGDNVSGKIPSISSPIKAEFRTLTERRGDVHGNVGAETINTLVSTITLLGDPVSLFVTNPLSASGGEPEESIDEAKIKGPRSLRALNRAVSAEDFQILTEQIPGVALANVVLVENTYSCCTVCIIIYPEGGGIASSVLKETILACLEIKKVVGANIEIKDAIEKKINIAGTIYLRDNFNQEETAICVEEEIDNFFNIDTGIIKIGKNINKSDIYPLIMNCAKDGVSYVDLNVLTIQPEAVLKSWSGDTIFEFIVPNKNSVAESWTISFFSQTQYTVTGSLAGLQQNIGTVSQTYVTDDPTKLTFKISVNPTISSPVPNEIGDTAIFSTYAIFDNIEIPEDCIAIKGNIQFSYIGGSKRVIKC